MEPQEVCAGLCEKMVHVSDNSRMSLDELARIPSLEDGKQCESYACLKV